MEASTRVLIAGIGNIFLGDDAFGSEVARRLQARPWPAGVRVVDFGIRGFDLAYALCDGNDLTVLIDATPRGGSPGTIYVIEPDLSELVDDSRPAALVDAHSLDPLQVLRMAHAQGAVLKGIVLVGCEPADLGGEEGRLGVSEPVAAAVDEALDVVTSLVRNFLNGGTIGGESSGGSATVEPARAGQTSKVESAQQEASLKEFSHGVESRITRS
jgi:hydrogenase maturation protease